MSKSFFEKINYSASNEDSDSERRSLMLNSDDTVLCITGSGSRPLDLLIDNPRQIISIDLNRTQNFLLELKIAAYKSLTYPEFCAFIGLKASTDRIATFRQIEHALSDQARDFWSDNIALIVKGVLYCGTWEKILKFMLRFSKPRTREIKALMNASSINEQQNIWNTKWDNNIWKLYLKILSNRFLWKYIVREPGAKLIPKSFDVYTYMSQRLNFMGTKLKMSESHFANLLFCGEYTSGCVLPHHLREENFNIIRKNIHKLKIVTDSLTNYLPSISNAVTAFSLSDFSSYADEITYHNVWEGVIHSAKDGAKFCERQYLVKRNPEQKFTKIKRNQTLENTLINTDVSFIYSFCAGQIIKS